MAENHSPLCRHLCAEFQDCGASLRVRSNSSRCRRKRHPSHHCTHAHEYVAKTQRLRRPARRPPTPHCRPFTTTPHSHTHLPTLTSAPPKHSPQRLKTLWTPGAAILGCVLRPNRPLNRFNTHSVYCSEFVRFEVRTPSLLCAFSVAALHHCVNFCM